jgi:hypothetical protein
MLFKVTTRHGQFSRIGERVEIPDPENYEHEITKGYLVPIEGFAEGFAQGLASSEELRDALDLPGDPDADL